MIVDKIRKGMKSLLFPPRCPICDRVLEIPKETDSKLVASYLCHDCRKKIQYTGEQVCQKCGKPVRGEREEYCYDCRKKQHSYDQGKAVFLYQGDIKRSLYRFKYSNRRTYAEFYGAESARLYGEWIRQKHIQAIIPIPLHPKKQRMRGYNQAELYAKELEKQIQIPIRTDILKRIVYTSPQKELNDTERKKNLKNALKIQKNDVKLNYILLVDDIYTTGSTIDAAAEAFREKGVEHIYFLSIGIGNGY